MSATETVTTASLDALRDELVAAHISHGRVFVGIGLARAVLASDWLAARDAEQRRKGAADLRDELLRLAQWCDDHGTSPTTAELRAIASFTAPQRGGF